MRIDPQRRYLGRSDGAIHRTGRAGVVLLLDCATPQEGPLGGEFRGRIVGRLCSHETTGNQIQKECLGP